MIGIISKLMELIVRNLPFNEQVYPELKGVSAEQRNNFAIRHNALHFAKTAGRIASACEGADHGGVPDVAVLKNNVVDSLVSTLRLAELLGMTENDLVEAIELQYHEQLKSSPKAQP